MKALVMYERKRGALEIRDIPKPDIGKKDILVRVKAAAICGSDIHFWEGRNAELLNTPVVLGHEFSGIIAQKGSDINDWAEGDRVVSDNTGYVCGKCEFCLTGKFVYCEARKGLGYGMDGGFAEYVKIPGDILQKYSGCLLKIPENASFEEASIIEPSCNAYRALFQDASFLPGATVMIFGPGAIGLFCVQLARIGGANRIVVVGVEGDERRLEVAKEFGADYTVISGKHLVDDVLDNNSGDYYDIAIDAAGPPLIMEIALKIIKRGGQIVRVGMNSQPFIGSLDLVVNKAVIVRGHFGYDYVSWQNVLRLLESGMLKNSGLISDILPLEHWREGFERMKIKEAIKVVLKP
jgi:threonine dehydrogenase-like Zn-dependent dehydrogenase